MGRFSINLFDWAKRLKILAQEIVLTSVNQEN